MADGAAPQSSRPGTLDPGNLLCLIRLSGLRFPATPAASNVGITSFIQRQGAETSQPGP